MAHITGPPLRIETFSGAAHVGLHPADPARARDGTQTGFKPYGGISAPGHGGDLGRSPPTGGRLGRGVRESRGWTRGARGPETKASPCRKVRFRIKTDASSNHKWSVPIEDETGKPD
ncbi:hypothetical protein GCM10012280_36930 [Wenjunlia tyrosinilytica]|uniref:Uncharacterized protein n=1 Tax=Wenjunlia tyrosinilytica TaxID=1544741 RepID=A0A918DZ94_9ACTN|nr:hypothetical protein GCM10012280_36930 [Wenjunlia tyrosinilytica]